MYPEDQGILAQPKKPGPIERAVAASGIAAGLQQQASAQPAQATVTPIAADPFAYRGGYQPRGEMGKAATELVTLPFQKLAEAGQYMGGKTLDATGSPLAATVVDTAVNALLMVIDPAIRAARKAKAGSVEATPAAAETNVTNQAVTGGVTEKGEVTPPLVTPQVTQKNRGFVPLDDAPPAVVAKAARPGGPDQ